ncbi:hypothetical protein POM88_050543 [Heracleum sosnowskyi]|uniref:Uncharacterized protein n=1 Tax=Heracleum sosnowskyi TaxID=360622 RepID=A0AAD8M2N7_9APIA|nr:hypothetical protein POM88_050543 [Heracleum sosnowskyi]
MGREIDGKIIGIEDLGTTHSCVGVWPSRNNNITTPFSPPATPPSISTSTPAFEGSDMLLAKVDGYWKLDERGNAISGIGGFVREARRGDICYIFSGPVTCDSSKAAAVAAISHIVGAIIDTNRFDREIQVHLDAKEAVQDIKNISQGSMLEKEMKEAIDNCLWNGLTFRKPLPSARFKKLNIDILKKCKKATRECLKSDRNAIHDVVLLMGKRQNPWKGRRSINLDGEAIQAANFE